MREEGPRDEDGYENPGDFFNANSSPQSVATTQYSVRRTAQSSRTYERSGSYEEEDVDMSLAETCSSALNLLRVLSDELTIFFGRVAATGISPSVYQRRTQALSTSTTVTASNSAARKPSSLRQSTLPSGSATTSRRGLPNAKTPSSGSRDGEEADARNQTSAQRRRLSSLGRDGREGRGGRDDDGEDEEPFVEDLDLGSDAEHDGEANTTLGDRTIQGEVEEEDEDEEEEEEEEEVRRGGSSGRKSGQSRQSRASEVSTSTRNETRASSAGLVKLDKNGKAVTVQDKKGKGKEVVRSPSPRYEQGGDGDMNNNFDTGDFGGGGDSDSEAAGFTYGDDGDDSEPQAQVEPDDEDQGVVSEELGVEHEDEDEPGSDAQEEEEEEQPRASKAKSKAKSQPKVKVVKGAPEKKRGKKRASDASDASGRTVVAKRARRATTVEEAVVERVPRDRDAGSVEVDGGE